MAITVKHSKVSTIPDDADTSLVRPSDWNADHTLVGLGTMAEQNANAVAITGGTITGISGIGDVVGPSSSTDNAVARFDSTTGKLLQNSVVTVSDTGAVTGITTLAASTSVTTPTVQATNSAGLSLKNSAGTTQISMGAGGGDNITLASSTNINGANAQIDISPTGTGHVHIKPTGVNSIEIAPTYVGEMDNITIGSITPKAGTFTTITGQTGVLRGTGSNLIKQSQTIGTSPWNQTGTATAAINSSGTTDPLGGNTASLITGATDVGFAGNAINQLLQTATAQQVVSGVTYTFSVYIKAGTATTMQIAMRDNSTGSVPTTTLTPTSSWQRISVSMTLGSSTTSIYTLLGGANGTFYAWGAQVEYGTVANTYIPTTTTAVYGTPTLSFSGVAGLGLESNGALYVSPAGTGALQAQATTSTTVGGNARGANAVDWQTSRSSAAQVASGSTSFIGSGRNNSSTSQDSIVVGGFQNQSTSSQSAVVSGARNSASGASTFIGSGNDNIANQTYATVVGGQSNSATGYYGFVGNGTFNSTTSSSAVTTQATTTVTSGSTSVVLTGSNANIRVGQAVIGTGITFPNTYVAAISGTALTLSQNAVATGTPTLIFFTPHGVVVGGGNNQATGSYSFIGGGGDAGTAANRNVASGDWSFVGGGFKNVASGIEGSIVGGDNNTASGLRSFIGAGQANTASATASAVLAGRDNTANAGFSSVLGGVRGTTRAINAYVAFGSSAPFSETTGSCQSALLVIGAQTTDATATALRADGGAAGSTNQVILPNNSAYFFTGEVVSGVTGGGNTKGWTIEGVIKRGANAAATTLVGSTVASLYADAGASAWTIALAADTTNGGLRVTFTGQAGTTIRTVCQIRTTEMTY